MIGQATSLRVSENGRFLTKEDGSLFFWLGDTAWELFHKLSRDEADFYLLNRAERKFNVIQAVALAQYEGLTKPNAHGRLPLLQNKDGVYDPSLPDLTGDGYNYWDHVDYMVKKAEELGMYVGLLPTWGDKFNSEPGGGPEIFTVENARVFGQFLGRRYKDQQNIIWVVGGDRILSKRRHFDIIHAMAEGLREGDEGRHLITFHPHGGANSAHYVHDEDWLDMNMIQSGHHPIIANYKMVSDAYSRHPTKPVLDGEPNYEDIPIGFRLENGFIDAADVRRSAYWSVFAGACGHTYGHHCVWYMVTEPQISKTMHWMQGLMRPGAAQMQHLRGLVESRNFMEYAPDQSLIVDNYQGANYMQATRSSNCALIYSPSGILFRVNMGIISGERVQAHWFNPRDGSTTSAGEYVNEGEIHFQPPSSGRGEDWVLVIEETKIMGG